MAARDNNSKGVVILQGLFPKKNNQSCINFFWTELISAMYIPDSIDRVSTPKIPVQEIIGLLKI